MHSLSLRAGRCQWRERVPCCREPNNGNASRIGPTTRTSVDAFATPHASSYALKSTGIQRCYTRRIRPKPRLFFLCPRKNTVFVERTIPDGAKPLSDPANTARFFLETQFPSLMKLATAIAHFDTVFSEVAAATDIAKDIRVWNPNRKYYRVHFGAIRSLLYAIQASRKADLPRPVDAPLRFNLLDPGPLLLRRETTNATRATLA